MILSIWNLVQTSGSKSGQVFLGIDFWLLKVVVMYRLAKSIILTHMYVITSQYVYVG